MVGDHAHVRPHVTRSRGDASRSRSQDQGRRFRQAAIARIRAIVEKRRIVLHRPFAHVEGDHGFALRHSERPENAFSQDFRQLAAIERPGQQSENLVEHVVVVEVLAGCIGRQVAHVRIGRKCVPARRHARGMRQEVMGGDRRETWT